MYRLRGRWTSRWVGLAVGLMGLVLVATGCQSGPEVKPDVSLQDKSDAEILHEAIRSVFDQRGLEVASSARYPRTIILKSDYHSVASRLRRRFTVRIEPRPGGNYELVVIANLQRRHGTGEQSVWRKTKTEATKERAERAELTLARQIERRFREWKEYQAEQAEESEAGETG